MFIQAILLVIAILPPAYGRHVWFREASMYESDDIHLAESLFYDMALAEQNGTILKAANGGRPGSAKETHSCSHVTTVPDHLRSPFYMWPYGLSTFYQKYTEAYGIPVLGSTRLSDRALRRACYVVRFLFADRPDLRQSFYHFFGRVALMATSEVTTNIPEYATLGPWWNSRVRGLGATRNRPVSTGGEENALCLAADKYSVEDRVLHEFSHGLHLLGATYMIRGFEGRLKALYNSARASGLWQNTYAMSTDREYWAEGVQSYFNANAYSNPPNGLHNHVNTRDKLRTYDPHLYILIKEVFPCGNTYISRCMKDRVAEEHQKLKMNCDSDGNDGNVSPPLPGRTTVATTPETSPLTPPGSRPSTPPGCEDKEAKCSSWAEDGWCDRAPKYMYASCPLSCETCWNPPITGMATPTTTPTTTSTTTTTTQAPPPLSCKDYNRFCFDWAIKGECQKNPAYMLLYCKLSCDNC